MRLATVLAGTLALLVAIAPIAAAHTLGGGSLATRGSFVLGPAGTSEDRFHGYLTSLGIPIGGGDTLDFDWFANNGSGPAVYFDIHAHTGPAGVDFERFYTTTATTDHGTWVAPRDDATFMLYWENLSNETITLRYVLQLTTAATDTTPLLLVIAVGIGFAAFAVWSRGLFKELRRADEQARSEEATTGLGLTEDEDGEEQPDEHEGPDR